MIDLLKNNISNEIDKGEEKYYEKRINKIYWDILSFQLCIVTYPTCLSEKQLWDFKQYSCIYPFPVEYICENNRQYNILIIVMFYINLILKNSI